MILLRLPRTHEGVLALIDVSARAGLDDTCTSHVPLLHNLMRKEHLDHIVDLLDQQYRV